MSQVGKDGLREAGVSELETFRMYIDGEWRDSASGRWFEKAKIPTLEKCGPACRGLMPATWRPPCRRHTRDVVALSHSQDRALSDWPFWRTQTPLRWTHRRLRRKRSPATARARVAGSATVAHYKIEIPQTHVKVDDNYSFSHLRERRAYRGR